MPVTKKKISPPVMFLLATEAGEEGGGDGVGAQ